MTEAQAPTSDEKIAQRIAEECGLDERAIRLQVVGMVMRQGPTFPQPAEMAEALTHFILTGERLLRPRPVTDAAAEPFTPAQEDRAAQIARDIIAEIARGADERIRTFVQSSRARRAR